MVEPVLLFWPSYSEVKVLIFLSPRQIFPSYSSAKRPICENSALARIRKKRAETQAMEAGTSGLARNDN